MAGARSGRLHRATLPSSSPSFRLPFLSGRQQHMLGNRGRVLKVALVPSETAVVTPEERRMWLLPEEIKNVDLLPPLLCEVVRRLIFRLLGAARLALTRQCSAKIVEALIEKGVVGCQSFTMIGVAGSLVGSVLCFVEGCVVVLKSYFAHFHAVAMSQMVDQGEILKLLIEAIDMFLVGTALLTFGMGLYIMFSGSPNRKKRELQINRSNLGVFDIKKLKEGAEIRSITQAKSRTSHAVLLLLQAGVLEKFKNVPLVSCLDMACFAGALLASSACVFLLSKLTMQQQQRRRACP